MKRLLFISIFCLACSKQQQEQIKPSFPSPALLGTWINGTRTITGCKPEQTLPLESVTFTDTSIGNGYYNYTRSMDTNKYLYKLKGDSIFIGSTKGTFNVSSGVLTMHLIDTANGLQSCVYLETYQAK
jgi:hypothetical protein